LGSDRVVSLSWHHQAIDRLAPGFRVVARAPDGVIEAMELPEHPELLCVQWHPELSAAEDPLQQRLFDELIGLVRAIRHDP
jgi:putative glutamine amidotransferase